MAILLVFLGLQLLDGATTLIFLAHGVSEANPLVGVMLRAGWHPAAGLAVVKSAACVLGLLAWRSGRIKLLWRANVFFAVCVMWNVTAIATA